MTRRAVPWTFFVGVVLCMVLLFSDNVRASRPGPKVPNVRGHLDGFFLSADNTVGLVHSDITQQAGRRISGEGRLLDAMTGHRLTTYTFSGTLAADDVLTATGKTPSGRFALHSDVQFFAGSKGNAAIINGQLGFAPKRGQASQLGAFLLQPFPDKHGTDLSGQGVGVCVSQFDPTFEADLTLQFLTSERNAFPGSITCVPTSGQIAPFSWGTRATVSDQGRLIVIAQGKTGQMFIDGSVKFANVAKAANGRVGAEATPLKSVDGRYLLQFHDGRRDFGAINFSLTPESR